MFPCAYVLPCACVRCVWWGNNKDGKALGVMRGGACRGVWPLCVSKSMGNRLAKGVREGGCVRGHGYWVVMAGIGLL